jgi:hypothetical protein
MGFPQHVGGSSLASTNAVLWHELHSYVSSVIGLHFIFFATYSASSSNRFA